MIPAWLPDTVTRDIDRAMHYTMLWGLEALELRMIGSSRVPHVINEEKLSRRLLEYDVAVASIIPGLFEAPLSARLEWMNDLLLLDDCIDFCKRLHCTRMVVSGFAPEDEKDASTALDRVAEILRQAAEKVHQAGITLAVINESDMLISTGAQLARLLAHVDHPACLAAWSPAEALRAGENPADGAQLLGERITLVRFRDGRFRGDTWQETLPGEGDVGWPEHLHQLHDQGFDGVLSMELLLKPAGKKGLQAATRMLQWMRQVS